MAEDFKSAHLVDRISINLTKDKEAALSYWINRKKESISYDREEYLERQKRFLFDFDDFITFTRKGPWDESANLHMPLTSIVVKTYHSRLYNIFSQMDTTTLTPREPMDEAKVEMLKLLRNWYIWDYINGYKGIKGVVSEMLYDLCTQGFGIIAKTWDIRQRKVLSLERNEFEREMRDLEGEVEKGKKLDVSPYREVQKVLTVFEGTRLFTVPFENCYFPNDIPESDDLNHPELVLVVDQMSGSELMLKAEQGLWDKEKVEMVMAESIPGRSAETREKNIKELRDRLTGYDTQNSFYNDPDSKRDVEYAFCTYDIDDDGVDEELIVTRSPKGTILNVNYLDRVSRTGARPLFKFDCFTKPRQAYSRGVVEFVHPLQEEMDMNHNLRQDYLQLQTCPFGVYRGSSSLDNQPIRIAPGKFIPVDDTNDLKPITFQSQAHLFAGEEDRLWRYAEWLTSVSPLATGNVPSMVGPTRSTSGVVTLLQQMDKQFQPMVDGVARNWKKLEHSLLEDLDYRVDPDLKMRVLGASIKEFVDQNGKAEDFNSSILLTQSFDLSINVASVATSDEVRRNEASILLQTIANPSLLQQAGVFGPKALYKAASEWLKAHGRDPAQYLDEPQFTTQPLTLFQEIQICAQGQVPPMSMTDNHEEKAAGLEQFMQTEEYADAKARGLYDENVDTIMNRTIEKHRALAQALQPRGMPNETGEQGQDMNALMAGTAPQQGGPSPTRTTSRDLAQPTPEGGEQPVGPGE